MRGPFLTRQQLHDFLRSKERHLIIVSDSLRPVCAERARAQDRGSPPHTHTRTAATERQTKRMTITDQQTEATDQVNNGRGNAQPEPNQD